MSSTEVFKRCNISEDLIKRFSKLQTKPNSGSGGKKELTKNENTKKKVKPVQSPTGKKVALEKLLLSVPLDADVANFTETKNPFIPLYSDSYEPSFCLPSAGYRSDSEGGSKRIRTSISANTSPQRSPTTERKVKRTRSLNTHTVTDKIFEIRERLIKVKKEKDEKLEEEKNSLLKVSTSNNKLYNKNSSVSRSRSFNTTRTLRTTRKKIDVDEKANDTKNLIKQIKNNLNSTDKIRQHFTTNTKNLKPNENKSENLDSSKNSLRSSSFSTLQDAWEYRRSTRNSKSESSTEEKKTAPEPIKDIPTEIDGEKVHRRHKRRGSRRGQLITDRSDSETESEDGHLTEEALKRLEKRTLNLRLSQSTIVRRRANRLDSESTNDENNNELTRFETSSDKTLDSGIFDLAISNLSEDISKLSKRYDSNEFLLDDCLSPKSGYSSATESLTSLAESTTTYYDSENDNSEMDNRKKRSVKSKLNPNIKTAVMNSVSKSLYDSSKSSQSKNIGHENCHKSTGHENCHKPFGVTSPTNNKGHVTPTNNEQIKKKDDLIRRKDDQIKKIDDHLSKKDNIDKHNTKKSNDPTILNKSIDTSKDDVKKVSLVNNKDCDNKKVNISERKSLNITTTDKNISSSSSFIERKSSVSKSNKSPLRGTKSLQQDTARKTSLAAKDKEIQVNKENQLKNNQNLLDKDIKKVSGANNMSFNNTTKDKKSIERKLSSTCIKNDSIKTKYAKTCLSKSLKANDSIIENEDDDNNIIENEIRKDKNKQNDNLIVDDKKKIQNGNKIKKSSKNDSDEIATQQDDMEFVPKTKFLIDRKGSLIDQSGSSNKLVRQGDSIELQISLDTPVTLKSKSVGNLSKLVTSPTSPTKSISTTSKLNKSTTNLVTGNNQKTSPSKTLKKTESTSTISSKPKLQPVSEKSPKKNSGKIGEQNTNNNKETQCLLLTDELKALNTKGTIVNVHDTSQQVYFNEVVSKELGTDILENIEFKLPEYLHMASLDSTDGGIDSVDSAQLINENDDPLKLKLENVRLHSLLFEVEKARAGSVKALLHVNNLLNKVQSDNIHLEGEMKVCILEKDKLNENIKTLQDNTENGNSNNTKIGLPGDADLGRNRSDTVDKSLSIIVSSWKNEKKNLMTQLNKSKAKEQEAEKDAGRLRIQYKKVKEQLEHSNNAFTQTMKNNLDATKRMEEELQNSITEKQELLLKLNEGKKIARELDTLKQEMDELENTHVELQDEKDQLEEKCLHLEKQKKSLLYEQEELHEQIGHSQEIIDKLSESEEDLKIILQKEIKEKEYLQECLDETGQILYQLKDNEQKLLVDKDTLLDDLEAELQEKEVLQSELTETMSEHQEIVDRLQQMNNIHITVRESLQQANKKEKNYQEEIEVLTKTNHILHYTLELEKEEKTDLQEMFQVIDMDHKKFKTEMVGKMRDMEKKNDEMFEQNVGLKEVKEQLEESNTRLENTNKDQADENESLTTELQRVEKIKESIERELENLRNSGDSLERNISELRKQSHDLEIELASEKKKVDNLTINIEETEESLEQVAKELTEAKKKLEEHKNDNEDLRNKVREKQKRVRDLETTLTDTSEQRDKYHSRMSFYEKETKDLRKQVNEQTEEIGTLQLESQRFARERDNHKRNCDMAVRDFETHKVKCTETLKKLKDEILDLSSKIVEKDRITMKQKEQFQDQIDNTETDLQLFRSMLDSDLKKRARRESNASNISETSFEAEKLDINVLKNSHGKFRDEYKNQMSKLEGMLRDSKEPTDTVTVVQSPMSKIKLEELKQIRNEIFDVNTELANLRHKFSLAAADIKKLQHKRSVNLSQDAIDSVSQTNKANELDAELSALNNLMVKIERRHQAVMSQNAILLQRTLTEDDRTAKDLVKKFQVVSLEGENKQLKTLLGILKKKYDFNEQEMAEELKKVSDSTNGISSSLNGNKGFSSGDEEVTSKSTTSLNSTPQSDSNLRFVTRSNSKKSKNYSFFNEMMTTSSDTALPATRTYNRELHTRSSGVSSYSSDEDDFSPPARLPKRYNSTSSRSRRPRT